MYINNILCKTLFTWSGRPRSSGIGFLFCVPQTNPTRPGSPTPCKQALCLNKTWLDVTPSSFNIYIKKLWVQSCNFLWNFELAIRTLTFPILHLFLSRPDLFNFDVIVKAQTRTRLENSFKMAEKNFGVPRYLDSAGMNVNYSASLRQKLLGHFHPSLINSVSSLSDVYRS